VEPLEAAAALALDIEAAVIVHPLRYVVRPCPGDITTSPRRPRNGGDSVGLQCVLTLPRSGNEGINRKFGSA
jgi:hypothetical protein